MVLYMGAMFKKGIGARKDDGEAVLL